MLLMIMKLPVCCNLVLHVLLLMHSLVLPVCMLCLDSCMVSQVLYLSMLALELCLSKNLWMLSRWWTVFKVVTHSVRTMHCTCTVTLPRHFTTSNQPGVHIRETCVAWGISQPLYKVSAKVAIRFAIRFGGRQSLSSCMCILIKKSIPSIAQPLCAVLRRSRIIKLVTIQEIP